MLTKHVLINILLLGLLIFTLVMRNINHLILNISISYISYLHSYMYVCMIYKKKQEAFGERKHLHVSDHETCIRNYRRETYAYFCISVKFSALKCIDIYDIYIYLSVCLSVCISVCLSRFSVLYLSTFSIDFVNKKDSENADTSTSVTFDLEL